MAVQDQAALAACLESAARAVADKLTVRRERERGGVRLYYCLTVCLRTHCLPFQSLRL